jgi:hypothetical protein
LGSALHPWPLQSTGCKEGWFIDTAEHELISINNSTEWHSNCDYFKKYFMIRKLKSGEYRIYSRKADAKTGKRRNLGTFSSLEAAKKHEREIETFKHKK